MVVPDYQTMMLPFLESLADGKEHSLEETRQAIASHFGLTDQDLRERIPTGSKTVFHVRVAWVRTALGRAGLVDSTRHGFFVITPRGNELLKKRLTRIDLKVLRDYPEFVTWEHTQKQPKPAKGTKKKDTDAPENPEEQIAFAHSRIIQELSAQLLDRILKASPDFFERLVLQLVNAIGYGAAGDNSIQWIGGPGDGGIDGIISLDPLGFDLVYIQAKRHKQPLAERHVREFVGAISRHRGRRGVLITTTTFQKSAEKYAKELGDPRIMLIDGHELARLMIKHNVGVNEGEKYVLKRIDNDFFTD